MSPWPRIVSAEEFERFREWQRRTGNTRAGAFDELRHIAQDQGWELEISPRASRSNPLLDVLDGERRSARRKNATRLRKSGR